MVRKPLHDALVRRLTEERRFLQVLAGPRQVGKTTLARQVMKALPLPAHYASADEPTLRDRTWIEQQWDLARLKAKPGKTGALLVLDEIQKVPGSSDIVKRLWDAAAHAGLALKVLLLGSSPLLIRTGLTESLAGRFELTPVPHWSFAEMREAFGWGLEQFIYYGAYPGAAPLIHEPERWRRYIVDSLIETINTSMGSAIELNYWRDRNLEVAFVLHQGKTTVSIEVKSGRRKTSLPGLEAFAKQFKPKRQLLVGGQGIALEEFLLQPAAHWLQ